MKKLTSICLALLSGAVLFGACSGDDNPAGPSAADRDKFVGNWAGTYECGFPPADTMIIVKGSGDLDFSITLHSQIFNADVVTGELTDVNVLTIPEQTMGGFPGSGEITYSNNVLSLTQRGFGITCRGSNYVKY